MYSIMFNLKFHKLPLDFSCWSDLLKSPISGLHMEVDTSLWILGVIPSGPGGVGVGVGFSWSDTLCSVIRIVRIRKHDNHIYEKTEVP